MCVCVCVKLRGINLVCEREQVWSADKSLVRDCPAGQNSAF